MGVRMKEILLPTGESAIVDDDDYCLVSQYRWYRLKVLHSNTIYAATNIRNAKRRTTKLMHRMILNSIPGSITDHKNGNGLDNQRFNIRPCSEAQNKYNMSSPNTHDGKPLSSQYKGVSWLKKESVWTARAKINGKSNFLGCFKNERDAAIAYDNFVRPIHGEFFRPNIA
jgi:hypothetical protein